MIVCNNQLATQLSRPQVYVEEDERIAREGEKSDGWPGVDEEKADGDVVVEKVG